MERPVYMHTLESELLEVVRKQLDAVKKDELEEAAVLGERRAELLSSLESREVSAKTQQEAEVLKSIYETIASADKQLHKLVSGRRCEIMEQFKCMAKEKKLLNAYKKGVYHSSGGGSLVVGNI